MPYKTILLHLENELQAPHVLKAAVRLAGQYQSHLIGTYIAKPLEPYVSSAGAAAYSAEIAKVVMKNEIECASTIEKLFTNATQEQNLVAEWRFDKDLVKAVSTGVLEQATGADVLIIGADLADADRAFAHGHIAPIITNCSRPTIVVPSSYQDKSLGDFVFVAWDGSKESSRAIFDALPILQGAQSVWLHRVKSSHEYKHHGDDATRNLADALARHEVNLETSESTSSTRNVGQEILYCARDRGADCIVMGAYGHSRMHGLLFGDVTRHLLENSRAIFDALPILQVSEILK